jgi:general secretion pathway protein G
MKNQFVLNSLQSRSKLVLRSSIKSSGFTLLEIIMVLVILGALMAIVGPRVMGAGDQAKQREAKIRIEQLGGALDIYKLEVGKYPESLQALVPNGAAHI